MNQIRVLVVDDEPDFLKLIQRRLTKRNVLVHTVTNGEAALAFLRENPVDVVILDVRMPGLSGIDTLKEIRKRFRDTEVIMLTGHGSLQSGIEGISLGAYDYILKPFSIDNLLGRIRAAFEHAKLRIERRGIAMSLTYARRVVMLGRSAFPVSCPAVGAAAWFHGRTGDGLALVAAVAVAGGMWLLLWASARWLDQAEAERAEMGDQLIQSQRILAPGELSTGIAHEINNPLNIILQEAELMRFNLADAPSPETLEEVRASLDVIYAQVSRCSDITHKLLDLARNRKPVSQPADINRLVEDMLELVERESGPRQIHIHRRLDQDLPAVLSDPPLLRQVFLNLLINAVQAVDKEGDIFITTYREGTMACTEIRDTGPGIPEEHRERIFNPFFTTKAPGQGTGLGLSVSLRIINELGGDILPASSPGKGASFTVRIPFKR